MHGDTKKVSDFLGNCGADIIALQEVMVAHKTIELTKHFTNQLGYHHTFADSFDDIVNGVKTKIGNAIFSKFPIKKSVTHTLSTKVSRVAIQADITLGNTVLHVFNTHFLHTHQKPSRLQNDQAQSLATILTKKNTILMGDFNALPYSNPINLLGRVLKNTDRNMLPTWSMYPEGCEHCSPQNLLYKLDNIFVSDDVRYSDFSVEKSDASDHLPISAIIDVA